MLTGKQARFVDAYMASPNGTQAAIKAGYSAKTARAIASENLRKPEIAAEIARRRQCLRDETDSQAQQVIRELARIAFANISGVIGPDGHIRLPHEWSPETWNAVKSVNYRERLGPGGDGGKRNRVAYRAAIKVQDKLWALAMLGEYLGMFPPRAGKRRRS
jgi:phage terminase small subunit